MSQVAAHGLSGGEHHAGDARAFSRENITVSGAGILPTALIGAGAVLLLLTILAGVFVEEAGRQALSAVHIGSTSILAICLGALFFTMGFHLVQAGWSATVRRQFENVMSLIWFPLIIIVLTVLLDIGVTGGQLFTWLNSTIAGGDVLLLEKSAYLTPFFFVFRLIVYVFVWLYLARRLWGYSTEQDRTGDKWLSNRARFTSSWGMLAFALTTAFAAFDLLMSLDWRFYSTMWGVYYFAGAAFSSVPMVVIVLAMLRRSGKLQGVVTEEHLHDLAKLMFGFVVFWAYIAFSQYFLIWYSAIPEETSWYLARKTGGWENLSLFLAVGHFLVPWYILLWRSIRRNFVLLAVMAGWAVAMHVIDIYWIVRPMVYAGTEDTVRVGMLWLDVIGILSVVLIFAGLLARKVASGPLVPLHDPRVDEALHHANWV
jgi:hypothetical protein